MIGAVADTHAVIWYLLDSPRLSRRAAVEFEQCRKAELIVGVSSMTFIEIIYLVEKGRIPAATLDLLVQKLQQPTTPLELVSITQDIALAVQQVPRAQVPDLPDRVIAATALQLKVPLISRDGKIRVSDVETIW
jgi:PIN domain nuclease of toxin-antitoxin system